MMQLLSRAPSHRALARYQPILTIYSRLCQPQLLILKGLLYNPANKTRSLTSTTPLYKKKDKSKPLPTTAPETNTSKNVPLTDNPYDLSRVESGIANAVSRLKDNLSKLRAGGRFNTDIVENLPVHLKKGSKESVKLGELAQVVPKSGRMTTVLVSEEEVRIFLQYHPAALVQIASSGISLPHSFSFFFCTLLTDYKHIKPISSSIIGSDLSLTPQVDPHNPLQLNIPIPPPTKESRDQTAQAAKQAWEKASNAIRDSRGAMHKHLQYLEKKRIAREDDVRSAHGKMEKLVEKGQKEAKDLFEVAKRGLEKI